MEVVEVEEVEVEEAEARKEKASAFSPPSMLTRRFVACQQFLL